MLEIDYPWQRLNKCGRAVLYKLKSMFQIHRTSEMDEIPRTEDAKALVRKLDEEASRPYEDDFDNYMKKVSLVENVLTRLSSGDPRISSLAMKEADQLLGTHQREINETEVKIKRDRTVINQKAFDEFHEKEKDGPETMHPNAFMRQIEADAKQRAEDRKQRKKESDRHKNEGNKAFREQKFAKALVCYDKAIDLLKDSCILYCNRALTYLKLDLPEKALKDAEMSLKANEKSLRGFIYKAQALWNMGKEEESREVIEEASQALPDQADYLRGKQELAAMLERETRYDESKRVGNIDKRGIDM